MTTEGNLVLVDGRAAVRFERRYRQPVARVWQAVTEPAEMANWFPSNVEGERALGASLSFVDEAQRAEAHAEGRPTRDEGPSITGTVVAYEPPHVFSFTWGPELLRFELTPEGEGTTLVFTHVLSHPSVAARNGAGWHQCLGGLDRLLEARPADAGAGGDWRVVYDDYVRRMGPELGTPLAGGAMTWERSTHVPPDRVREATDGERPAWGAAGREDEPVRWQIDDAPQGTLFHLVHDGIGDDAERAAAWHALLVQLDLYLAAGQLVPVDPQPWIPRYREVLGGVTRTPA